MAGRYKAYPEYKDSGVGLLGDIPSHWAVDKFRYLFFLGRGLGITKANLQDSGIPCVNYGEIHSRYGFEVSPDTHPLRCVSEYYLESSPNSLLENGDCIFADTSEDIEGAGNFTQLTSDQALFAGYHTIIARPKGKNDARFLAYILDSPTYRTQIQLAVKGVKVFSITQEILKNTDFWLPPPPEQKQIARFLDHETAKIDRLIAKQQALIALLKEKRQAVISHAATKGLNPNAKMKDSGVEWLGEVPEHWEVVKIGWNFKAEKGKKGQLLTKEYCGQFPGQFPVYSGQTENKGVMGSIAEYEFDTGNDGVLFSTTVGAKAMSLSHSTGKFSLSQNCMIISPRLNGLFVRFFYYHFQPLFSYERNLIPDHMQASFRMEDLYQYSYALPSQCEQVEISAFLDMETGRFDLLLERSKQQIHLLQERRTALISAAVTGKIDVREWEPTAPGENDQD